MTKESSGPAAVSASELPRSARRVPLATRYAIGLFVVVVLVVFGEVYRARMTRAHRENARLLQVAEKQRTLSQKLVNSALLAVSATGPESERAALQQLRTSLANWQAGRRALLEGASAATIDAPNAQLRLITVGPQADDMSRAAQDLVNALEAKVDGPRESKAPQLEHLMRLEDSFFGAMEEVTLALVDDYDYKVAQLLERDRVRLYVILGVLLVQALIVLVPLSAVIRAAFKNLRSTNEALDLALVDSRIAAQSKADFLATTSHELRTPLNAVIGLSSLLQSTTLDERQRQFVETINNSGEHLLQLINDILDLSKIEAGKLSLEDMEFEVRDLVESSVETLALRAETKNVELLSSIAADIPRFARGDAGRIRQVLLNLLSNAVKFTDAGHVLVRVTAVDAGGTQPRVRFEVEDTGAGIPVDVQKRLFQPFTQADSSTTRRFGGTGLGLSISRKLVELMGGSISLTSVSGTGSTFSFDVPLVSVAHASDADESGAQILAGKRAIVITDAETNWLVLRDLLAQWKVDTRRCGDAPSAFDELARARTEGKPYDAVLIDSHVPESAIAGFTTRMRSDVGLRTTKLVLVARFSAGRNEVREKAAGFDATVVKPIRYRALFRAMRSLYEAVRDQRRDAAARPQFTGKRVLVADDNAVNVLVARSMLERMDISVEVAGNGVEALAAAERTEFDLILMDMQMPELDGPDATRELRRREIGTGRHVPVVAVTASAMSEDRVICEAAGMDDYVTKPIPVDVMVATARRWLGARVTDAA